MNQQQQTWSARSDSPFRLDKWIIHPAQGIVSHAEDAVESRRIKPRAMEVLCFLAQRAGDVVSVEEILDTIWGQTNYAGPNAVRKSITGVS